MSQSAWAQSQPKLRVRVEPHTDLTPVHSLVSQSCRAHMIIPSNAFALAQACHKTDFHVTLPIFTAHDQWSSTNRRFRCGFGSHGSSIAVFLDVVTGLSGSDETSWESPESLVFTLAQHHSSCVYALRWFLLWLFLLWFQLCMPCAQATFS